MIFEIVLHLDIEEWKTDCYILDVLCEAVVPMGAKKIIVTTEVSLDFLLANDPPLSKCGREREHSFPHEKSFCIFISKNVYTHCSVHINSQNFILYVLGSSQMSLSMEGA